MTRLSVRQGGVNPDACCSWMHRFGWVSSPARTETAVASHALRKEGRARADSPRLDRFEGGDSGGRGARLGRAPANVLTTTLKNGLCFCIHELVGTARDSLRR